MHREDALAVLPADLLLAHPSEQAQVIVLLRLCAAPLAEFADLAMLVEHQTRRLAAVLELLDLIQHPFRMPVEL